MRTNPRPALTLPFWLAAGLFPNASCSLQSFCTKNEDCPVEAAVDASRDSSRDGGSRDGPDVGSGDRAPRGDVPGVTDVAVRGDTRRDVDAAPPANAPVVDGSLSDARLPVRIDSGHRPCPPGLLDVDEDGTHCDLAIDVTVGEAHSCAVSAAGTLHCWGDNTFGQLGDGTREQRDVPVRVGQDANWEQVAAGSNHTCGVRNSMLYCWGSGQSGQFGGTTTTDETTPLRVGTEDGWTELTVGGVHACGLRDGRLSCWGGNYAGSLGTATPTLASPAVVVGTETDWTQVTAGFAHTCALRAGRVYCWGDNTYGQAAGDKAPFLSTPRQVGNADDWHFVVAGDDHACGLRAGTLYCWGHNALGQVGDGTLESRGTPAQIGAALNWEFAAAGGTHTCAIRLGSLYCWGHNYYGQLGDGTTTARLEPVKVGTGTNWQSVSAGGDHTCGIRAGKVYCWGDNSLGQLGSDAVPNSATPVPIRSDVAPSNPVREESSPDADAGLLACDPIEQTGCERGALCSIVDLGDGADLACTRNGNLGPGESCPYGIGEAWNECAPGLVCADYTCRALCDADWQCPDGQCADPTGFRTEAFFPSQLVGKAGVCVLTES